MRVRLTVIGVATLAAPSRRTALGSADISGRWWRKPVQNRHGPATVTGGASPHEATGAEDAPGRRGEEQPGSQETCLRPDARQSPRGKGWLQMLHRLAGAFAGLIL